MSDSTLLESAVAAHRAGRLAEARRIYERIVRDRPDQADAWNLLGTFARQESRPSEAIEYISRAIELSPQSPDYHFNLGEALRASGQLDRAIEAYQKSLALRPTDADVYDAIAQLPQFAPEDFFAAEESGMGRRWGRCATQKSM